VHIYLSSLFGLLLKSKTQMKPTFAEKSGASPDIRDPAEATRKKSSMISHLVPMLHCKALS
jgi:hypothetical protein